MTTPGRPPMADAADSPKRFCADFALLLDSRKVSLRSAEAGSGWGKTTIAAARQGPALPNVDLVVDVLAAIGETQETQLDWRKRHERLRNPNSIPTVATPSTDTSMKNVPEPVLNSTVSRRSRWRRPRVLAAVTAFVLVVVGVTVWLLTTRAGSGDGPERTIVVQNKVAIGPSDLREDDTPSYLAARPIRRCANVPGCKLAGTDLASGDTVEAICQLQGALLTNANVQSPGVRNNPNVAASTLWYGVRWRDGRRGYLSEVYIAPEYRGGLQLPPC